MVLYITKKKEKTQFEKKFLKLLRFFQKDSQKVAIILF